MRYIMYALPLLITFGGMPAPAWAADAPTDEQLRKRIQNLNSRIERLERRERSETAAEKKERKEDRKAGAKAGSATTSTAATAARKEPTAADWAKVKIGMQEHEVRAILGEPLSRRTSRDFQIWSFHDSSKKQGEVWFRNREAERVQPPK